MGRLDEAVIYLANDQQDYSHRQLADIFQKMTAAEVGQLLETLRSEPARLRENGFAQRLERAIPYLADAIRKDPLETPEVISLVEQLYNATPEEANLRNGWLYWLAVMGSQEALDLWLRLISAAPPVCRSGIVWSFAPLLKHAELSEAFLESLLVHSLEHPQIAGVALDLLNYQFREGFQTRHPAQSRIESLASLMAGVAQQLARIEEGNLPSDMAAEQISQLVNDSVSLLISLCDLMALCKYSDAEGKLRQVMGLKHRRVQTEASAALARLGVSDGRQHLLKLAREPVTRMRAIAYAKEIGAEGEIDEVHLTPLAQAESRLATWLSEPTQMGIAPGAIDLIDERRLFWPGYDDRIDCFLFRFSYGSGSQQYSNVGIVGPMTFAFDVDVTGMSPDDLYAAFAGWQAEHEELYEVPLEQAYRLRSREIQEQRHMLEDQGFDEIEPQFAAHFFGDWLLVATAELNGNAGVAIADGARVHWFIDNGLESNPQFAYLVYRGSRLLSSFNDT